MKTLDDTQLESFDIEYVDAARWEILEPCLKKSFPDGNFSFIDIGGGNGMFADQILSKYPQAQGTVLDNAQLLLDKNKPHDRKKVILESVENLSSLTTKYDLVFFNWVLHHLVGDSYSQTRDNIDTALLQSKTLLKPGGKLSIFENMYNGLVIDNAPSHIIYNLTSSKKLAQFIKTKANTAGVGVCFLSRKCWHSVVANAGYEIDRFVNDDEFWNIPWYWHVLLTIDHVRYGHFWLSAKQDVQNETGEF